MKIFLSHSSTDKAFVRRVNNDLRSHKFETWLDEEQVLLGGSISKSIEEGLKKSQIVLLFLSERSVKSAWVDFEWRSKFLDIVDSQKIAVIPILMDEIEIPPSLIDRRYADFRKKDQYETNLSHLLRTLSVLREGYLDAPASLSYNGSSILEYTKELIEDLSYEYLSFPTHRRLLLIDTLKKLPRSGKHIRLLSYRIPGQKVSVKIRSVYDHLISMAHVGDCLIPYIVNSIRPDDYSEIARCIAYHELNEVILGDIPTYTSLSNKSRSSARVYAEERLRSIPPQKRSQIVGDLIWMYLGEKHRKSIEAYNAICNQPDSPIYVAFKTLDKIDPIIAVWRYLHHYRGKLGPDAKEFNKRMKDFYENPDVRTFLKRKNVSLSIVELAILLQNRTHSWDYYLGSESFFEERSSLFSVPPEVVRQAIEGVPLFS